MLVLQCRYLIIEEKICHTNIWIPYSAVTVERSEGTSAFPVSVITQFSVQESLINKSNAYSRETFDESMVVVVPVSVYVHVLVPLQESKETKVSMCARETKLRLHEVNSLTKPCGSGQMRDVTAPIFKHVDHLMLSCYCT